MSERGGWIGKTRTSGYDPKQTAGVTPSIGRWYPPLDQLQTRKLPAGHHDFTRSQVIVSSK